MKRAKALFHANYFQGLTFSAQDATYMIMTNSSQNPQKFWSSKKDTLQYPLARNIAACYIWWSLYLVVIIFGGHYISWSLYLVVVIFGGHYISWSLYFVVVIFRNIVEIHLLNLTLKPTTIF